MKKILGLFCIFLLCSAFQCDDEPLEGEFEVFNATECQNVQVVVAQAALDFSEATEANFTMRCTAYANALEAQIIACGDDDGTIQDIIDDLGDCSAIDDFDCQQAINAKNEAEVILNASTDVNYTENCNALRLAIENAIDICGSTVELEAQLESLGNCILTTTETSLLRQKITTFVDSGVIETANYNYNGNFLSSIVITESNSSDEFRYEYTYENEQLTKIEFFEGGSLVDYVELNYDSQGRLSNYVVYITLGTEGLRFDLEYNQDGTITEKKYSGDHNNQLTLIGDSKISLSNGQIISVEEIDNNFETFYEYDTNNGIYNNISNIGILNLVNSDFSGYIDGVNNNLLKITENDNGTISVFEEFTYTYNNSNYPQTASYFYEDVLEETIEFIYE